MIKAEDAVRECPFALCLIRQSFAKTTTQINGSLLSLCTAVYARIRENSAN